MEQQNRKTTFESKSLMCLVFIEIKLKFDSKMLKKTYWIIHF
jgi:hypothetical protein